MKVWFAGMLTAVMVSAVGGASAEDVQWPTDGWSTAVPEDHGLSSGKLADGLAAMREERIHSLLVVLGGDIVLDAYYYPYQGETVHELASVTKSVTTALVAIAAEEGKLGLDDAVLSYFPDRTIANRDARKDHITIRHLAEMASGFDCADDGQLRPMMASGDWVQFALDLPMTSEPGSTFEYCSAGTHLLSAILQKVTGETTLEYAREKLFEPLGIREVIWPSDPQGVTRGFGDLHLFPQDMAKIGYLWLHEGAWEGRQIVSREWVKAACTRQMVTGRNEDYGYGWWVSKDEHLPQCSAFGSGGQRISVVPAFEAVIAITAGEFETGEAMDRVGEALIAPGSQPADPSAGQARLREVLADITQAPKPRPVPEMPESASAISGTPYVFDDNPLALRSMRLDFDGTAEASLSLSFADGSTRRMGIGLDGVFRWTPGDNGLPVGLRAVWSALDTFAIDYDTVASIESFNLRARFEGDRVALDAVGRGGAPSVTLFGHVAKKAI